MRRREHFGWVVIRLEYWGQWMADRAHGLGYAGRTNEGRLMDDGQIGLVTNYRDHSPQIEYSHKEHETDRAVQKLPGDWRYVVYRLHVDNKTPAEIAEQVGRSEAGVKKYYDLAIAYLAAAIPQEKISA